MSCGCFARVGIAVQRLAVLPSYEAPQGAHSLYPSLARSMVDLFSGRILVNLEGGFVDPEQALENKIVGLYFSAAWCSLCRDFTPTLCDFYSALVDVDNPAPLRIVFISSDRNREEMASFMYKMHPGWLALPFHDPFKQ
ncbi:hypothetical protein Chor_007719 [Crotalus horridus]